MEDEIVKKRKPRKKVVFTDGTKLPLGNNVLEQNNARRKLTPHEINTVDPKKVQKEINRLNRQRSKTMERYIAKRLGGNRVLMSGAGYIKGDVTIPYKGSTFLIECKLTESVHKYFGPSMHIPFNWLTKIEYESRAMRSLFGLLIIKYHNVSGHYVFMPVDKLHYLKLPVALPIRVIDFIARDTKAGKQHAGATVHRKDVLEPVQIVFPHRDKHGFTDTRKQLVYYVYELEQFATYLDVE